MTKHPQHAKECNDKPALEIEITDEMERAGVIALEHCSGVLPDFLLVREVYRAMDAEREPSIGGLVRSC